MTQICSTRKCTVKYSLPTSITITGMPKANYQYFGCYQKATSNLVEKLKSKKSVFNKRSTHSISHNIRDPQKELAEDHIQFFLCQESHYSRHSSKTMYLNPDVNIATMFKLFKRRYPETSIKLHTIHFEKSCT